MNSMKITVNGNQQTVNDDLTIEALLAELNAEPDRVAVVLNEDIAPRAKRNAIALKEGDRVELITFAGGG